MRVATPRPDFRAALHEAASALEAAGAGGYTYDQYGPAESWEFWLEDTRHTALTVHYEPAAADEEGRGCGSFRCVLSWSEGYGVASMPDPPHAEHYRGGSVEEALGILAARLVAGTRMTE